MSASHALTVVSALVVVYVLGAGPASTYSSGAPVGFAGNFQNSDGTPQVCTACHTGAALNAGGGGIEVTAPASVAPGETVQITVAVDNQTPEASSGSRRQGFQATVVDAATRDPVGQIAPLDASTKYAGFGGAGDTLYVTHTAGGTAAASWTFAWTAPADLSAPVRVYAAANAANGDGESSGDRIYAASADLAVAGTATAADAPVPAFDLSAPRPNPAAGGRASVDLSVGEGGRVEVALVDGLGRRVRATSAGSYGPGSHRLEVGVAGLAAGTYFVVAEGRGGRRVRPLVVGR